MTSRQFLIAVAAVQGVLLIALIILITLNRWIHTYSSPSFATSDAACSSVSAKYQWLWSWWLYRPSRT